MARFYFLMFALIPHLAFTQEADVSKCIHIIAGGPHLLANSNKEINHEYTRLNYSLPAYYGFYKILLSVNSVRYVGFTLRVSHREGNAVSGYSGLSSSEEIKGGFSLSRADIGGELGRWVGKNSNIFIGTGIYMGKIVQSVSSGEKRSWYITSGGHSETLTNLPILVGLHGGVSFEALQQIRILRKNYFLVGLNLQIESHQVYRARLGAICNVVVGYKFGKNAVINSTERITGQR